MGELTLTPKRLRGGWHEARASGRYTLARHWPPRLDLRAEAVLPVSADISLRRLAQQVRQDMWRALQGLRGYSPVVDLYLGEGDVKVVAGGRLMGRAPDVALTRLQDLLDDPVRRARWIAWAQRRAA